jgi:hypothetical protein
MLTKIDLSAAIRRQVFVLLDKIVKTPMFVTGRLTNSNLYVLKNCQLLQIHFQFS